MEKEKVEIQLDRLDLPVGSKDWFIEDVHSIMSWVVQSDFYNTSMSTLEGLYKPISLAIEFDKLDKLKK